MLSGLRRFALVIAACAVTLAEVPAGSAQDLVAKGRALFNDTKLSGDGKWSCATCHPDNGHTDNKTYVGVTVVPDGDPKGRSTPTLWAVGTRQAYSWAGTAPSLAGNIRGIIVNRMKGPEPSAEDLDALVAYVKSLDYPANPFLEADGTPTSSRCPRCARSRAPGRTSTTVASRRSTRRCASCGSTCRRRERPRS